jgi:hypothetical protein
MKHFKKPCHAGAAYLCQGYVGKFPDETKALYKTVWEMSMKNIIDQSLDRSIFIDFRNFSYCWAAFTAYEAED